jgi:hypothetical protein
MAFSPVYRGVPVENFLQHLDVGDQTLSSCYQALQDDR